MYCSKKAENCQNRVIFLDFGILRSKSAKMRLFDQFLTKSGRAVPESFSPTLQAFRTVLGVSSHRQIFLIFEGSLSGFLPPSGRVQAKFSDPKSVQFLKNLTFTPLQGLKKRRPQIRKKTMTVDEIYLKEVPKISGKKKTR